MSRTALKFPRRVRIHGGEFDESARAIHREDGLKTIQAESGIVLGSTIERKQMSTKTTFKRVALVAVAALGFGVMSVAPSSAAADTMTLGATASPAVTGTAVTNTITLSAIAGGAGETITATVALISAPATSASALVIPAVSVVTAQATANTAANAGTVAATNPINVVSQAAGRYTGAVTISVTPDVAGDYVYRVTPSGGTNATVQTWTVTATAPDYAVSTKTTSFIGATTTVATVDAVVSASKTASGVVATITVLPKNAADAEVTVGNSAFVITATVSGPGSVKVGSAGSLGRAVSGAADERTVLVYSDGTAGVSTITLKIGTLEIAKETVTFYGAATTITPTVVKSILNTGANNNNAITAIVTDAAGVPVPGEAITTVSDTAATIAVTAAACDAVSSATGLVECDLNGLAAGTAGITLKGTNTESTAYASASQSVRVSDGTATTVSYTFDKATYAPGETAKIKATVSNAAGLMPGGATYTATTGGVTANYSIGSSLAAGIILAAGNTGSLEYTVVMPTGVSGTVQLTGTAATGYTVSYGSADVVNEALDAALEAIDAATNAEIAATAAIEAASDAQAAAEEATVAAEEAGLAAVEAGEMAVAAAEAAGAIAQDALDAAIAATDAATDALDAANEAKASADLATEAATAAGAAVEALSTKVATLIAGLNAKVTTLSNLLAKIAKKLNVK